MQIRLVPRFLIQKIARSECDAVHINALISIFLLTGLFLWLDGLRFVTSLPHFCLFEYAVGAPCPGCDITAALAALAHFHVHRSVVIQPCGFVLVITVFAQSMISVAYLFRLVDAHQAHQDIKKLDGTFLAVLLLVWIFRLFNQ